MIVCVSMECDGHLCLSEDAEDADNFEIVGDVAGETALVSDLDALVRVNDTRLEDKFGSGLVDADLTPVCHFLEQLEQVHFVGEQARVAVIRPDILDNDLATTEEGQSKQLSEVLVPRELQWCLRR